MGEATASTCRGHFLRIPRHAMGFISQELEVIIGPGAPAMPIYGSDYSLSLTVKQDTETGVLAV
jgi:hypothetical protein